jgi:amidohydrolase
MDRVLLRKLIDENFDWAVAKRRALHQIPEEGFKEFKTQQLICDTLEELGIPYTTERTWVIGLIEGELEGDVVGIRADIDALPMEEPEGCDFRSEHAGMMHACGHDAHTAILLGAAKVLSSMRDKLHGKVELLFQPAEEILAGAMKAIGGGILKNPEVDCAVAIHVLTGMEIDVGSAILPISGIGAPGADFFKIITPLLKYH